MKIRTFIILIIIYLISFITLKTKINLFYPYYLLKDIIFFPVKAVEKNVSLDKNVIEGIDNELKREIEELKTLNNLSSTLIDFDTVSATIIERNKMYWFNTITINKGSSSNIKEDMAVITGSGLIGRINKVSSRTSEIKLISTNDNNHKISVCLKLENDNIYGILSGYDNENNYLHVISTNKEIEIPKGTLVYTSGMGGIFPSGILIGSVENTIKDKYDVSKIINIKPSANLNDLHFVKVLIRK